MYKRQVRVLGIDDAPFDKFRDRKTLVVGVVYRGGDFMDGVLSTTVSVDGNNATLKLIEMVNSCKYKCQLKAVFLDGIALGGFNIVDVKKMYEETHIPVIVVMRHLPDIQKIEEVLTKLGKEKKIVLLRKAGAIHRAGRIYVQCAGISLVKVHDLLRVTCTHADIPEPLRIAHIIGAGIVKGESRGKA